MEKTKSVDCKETIRVGGPISATEGSKRKQNCSTPKSVKM